MELENIVDGKRVLFITTHRIDYIRNTQELLILNKHAKSVDILYGNHNNHILSAFKVIPCVWFSSLDKYDVIMVSYMCQMVIPFITSKIKNKTLIVDFLFPYMMRWFLIDKNLRKTVCLQNWHIGWTVSR